MKRLQDGEIEALGLIDIIQALPLMKYISARSTIRAQ